MKKIASQKIAKPNLYPWKPREYVVLIDGYEVYGSNGASEAIAFQLGRRQGTVYAKMVDTRNTSPRRKARK